MRAIPKQRMRPEAFLKWEREPALKSEFHWFEPSGITGARFEHGTQYGYRSAAAIGTARLCATQANNRRAT